MGMSEEWERIVQLIPPSRRSTPEQQQRLMQMQMAMLMGVKAMGSQRGRGGQQPGRPARAQLPLPFSRAARRFAVEEEEKGEEEEKEEEEEDEEEDELDLEEEVEDEEGDDAEVLAIKAEIRRVRAEKAAQAVAAAAPPPSLPPSADDLAEFAHQLLHPTIDDPD